MDPVVQQATGPSINLSLHPISLLGGLVSTSSLAPKLAHVWLWIVVIGYIVAITSFFIIVYATMRLFDLRKREAEFYGTVISSEDSQSGEHPRWAHIQALAGGGVAQCREAIIEADIMLDEVLTNAGYAGDTIAEKLQSADQLTFGTLQDAWEAHKVRNQIAHEGSAFKLSEAIANRTLARYEAVFREFRVI